MGSWISYLNILVHVALLFFIVPLRIDKGPIEELDEAFKNYLQLYNKTYSTEEYLTRLKCFNKSLAEIKKLNSEGKSAIYGLTKLSDLKPEEFLRLNQSRKVRAVNKRSKLNIKDLQDKGFIYGDGYNAERSDLNVAWANSIVDLVETVYDTKYLKEIRFSLQQIIDLFSNRSDIAVCDAFKWLAENKIKLQPTGNYPIKSIENNQDEAIIDEVLCQNFVGSEEAILFLLQNYGPVLASVNAKPWQNYVGGVIESNCPNDITDLNHNVLIHGYEIGRPIPFYWIRNYWGEEYGVNVEVFLAYGNNVCGIAMEVVAITVL